MCLALNNSFGRVLVNSLLLVICLLIHRIEKEDQFIGEKQGICKKLSLIVAKTPIHHPRPSHPYVLSIGEIHFQLVS